MQLATGRKGSLFRFGVFSLSLGLTSIGSYGSDDQCLFLTVCQWLKNNKEACIIGTAVTAGLCALYCLNQSSKSDQAKRDEKLNQTLQAFGQLIDQLNQDVQRSREALVALARRMEAQDEQLNHVREFLNRLGPAPSNEPNENSNTGSSEALTVGLQAMNVGMFSQLLEAIRRIQEQLNDLSGRLQSFETASPEVQQRIEYLLQQTEEFSQFVEEQGIKNVVLFSQGKVIAESQNYLDQMLLILSERVLGRSPTV